MMLDKKNNGLLLGHLWEMWHVYRALSRYLVKESCKSA